MTAQPKAVDINGFVNFLRLLRARVCSKRILLTLDNLPVHHSKIVAAEARKLNIDLLFWPIYSSPFHAIELVWYLAKLRFRKRILDHSKKVLKQEDVERMVIQSIESVPRMQLLRNNKHCLRKI